jgi:hypothetical protein
MSDEIVIDKASFHARLSSFITQWKSDKRSDALFSGVGSIVICVGKASDGAYPKSAAFQVGSQHTFLMPMLTTITVVAARLRVPCNAVRHHTRGHSHCDNQEEG